MGKKTKKSQDSFVWLSYSDLATGLMCCFILIFIIEKHKNQDLNQRNQKLVQEAIVPVVKARDTFNEVNELIVSLITNEKNCAGTKIQIRPGHPESIQFTCDESSKNNCWFKSASSELEEHAKKCLDKVGKRWLEKMYEKNEENKKHNIAQIKNLIIEGHTNSRPRPGISGEEANFLDNLELSQQRAFKTAKYILKITPYEKMNFQKNVDPKNFDKWKRKILSANGRSYSDKKYLANTTHEDYKNSRRVEFKYTLQHNYEKHTADKITPLNKGERKYVQTKESNL